MKAILANILIFAVLGGIIATLNRLLIYANDPDQVTRKDDGKIHWNWMLFHNTVRVMVAICSSVFVGVVILPHVSYIDQYSMYAIAGMSAIVGEQIWNILGSKVKNFTEKWGDTTGETETRRSRRGVK